MQETRGQAVNGRLRLIKFAEIESVYSYGRTDQVWSQEMSGHSGEYRQTGMKPGDPIT